MANTNYKPKGSNGHLAGSVAAPITYAPPVKRGEYTKPVEPVVAAPMSADASYKSTNQQVWGEGGTGIAGENAEVAFEKDRIEADPSRGQSYTQEELDALYKEHGIVDTGSSSQRADVMTWQEGAAAGVQLKPTSDPNYGYVDGMPRPYKPGDAGADEDFMTDADYQLVQYYKSEWNRYNELAQKETDPVKKQEYLAMRDQQNTNANRVRLKYDYSGGADGSMYLTAGQLGTAGNPSGGTGSTGGSYGGYGGGAVSSGASNPTDDLKSLLEAWQDAALKQSDGKIDYAVQQAVAELERALADAQIQYKEQAESVDRDARQAMDNSALYAELRGDRGGIGQEQYNSIQNTQAQNHLAVQQAQTKLATDTERQIADLRAQGEFEKADAALEITQTYLAQLISLEQWAAEYNLSVEQFNESIRQWEAEYKMAMQKLQISQKQWQQEFDYNKQLDTQKQYAAIAEALLGAGIPLTSEQMAALQITPEQADRFLAALRPSASGPQSGGNDDSGDDEVIMDYDGLFAAARESGRPQSFIANNYKKYGFNSNTALYSDYEKWLEIQKDKENSISDAVVMNLGAGMLSHDEVISMLIRGILEAEGYGGNTVLRWADGWNAQRYKNER